MARFALRRLLMMGPMVFIVLTLTFVMVQMAPGSPFSSQRRLPPEIEANLNAKYGFDQPKHVQYIRYMGRLLGFEDPRSTRRYTWHPYPDFGDSTKYKDKSVNDIIKEALPVSAVLGLVAYLFALAIGLATGILPLYKQNTWVDYILSGVSTLGAAVPNFILGPVLILVFSVTLAWLPPARMDWAFEWGYIRIPTFRTVLLPAVTLSALHIAYIARLTRAGLVEILRQDYIRSARAKGLPEWRVMLVHALRGAILPVVSFTGPALAFLITGTVVVERMFLIPGLGGYFIDAANNRDHFLLLGLTAFGGIALMVANLTVDIASAYIDPESGMSDTAMIAGTPEKGVGLWQDAWKRLRRNKAGMTEGVIVASVIVLSLVGPWLVYLYNGFGYDTLDLDNRLADPTLTHLLGTDTLGRDLFARVLYGSQISLMVGLVSTLIALLIGVTYGAIAGYLGGRLDGVMMRAVDILYSLPDIIVIVILMALFERSFLLLFVALGATSWLTMARIVRGQVLSLKNETFIEASRGIGVSNTGIILRHIVPNTLGPVITYGTLTVPALILAEAFLSFLGLGVPPPASSLGVLAEEGAQAIAVHPILLIAPATLMAVMLLSLNLFGDALRDALDPRARKV